MVKIIIALSIGFFLGIGCLLLTRDAKSSEPAGAKFVLIKNHPPTNFSDVISLDGLICDRASRLPFTGITVMHGNDDEVTYTNYLEGKVHGIELCTTKSGIIKSSSSWSKGWPIGPDIEFSENGSVDLMRFETSSPIDKISNGEVIYNDGRIAGFKVSDSTGRVQFNAVQTTRFSEAFVRRWTDKS